MHRAVAIQPYYNVYLYQKAKISIDKSVNVWYNTRVIGMKIFWKGCFEIAKTRDNG